MQALDELRFAASPCIRPDDEERTEIIRYNGVMFEVIDNGMVNELDEDEFLEQFDGVTFYSAKGEYYIKPHYIDHESVDDDELWFE